tara:strand:- start:966 stop:1727 length:762 start_codon:yes stop_codon:yes gene_type:complete
MFKLPNIPNYLAGNKVPIGWSPSLIEHSFLDALSDRPEKVVAQKLVAGGITYCPAFASYYKNVFAIKMPFKVIFNKLGGRLSTDMSPNIAQGNKHSIFSIEEDPKGVAIQILLSNLFISDKPYTIIETMPPILHGCREEITYMNGRFDCHAWQRPLHFGFRISKEVLDKLSEDDSIVFEKGEVVMYVRFTTPDDRSVTMHQISPTDLDVVRKYTARNVNLNAYVSLMNYKEIFNRVRYRRPKKFLRDLNYDNN